MSKKSTKRKEEDMKVFGFMYNDNIHESAWCTISLHFDRCNAKKELWKHMKKAFLEFKEYKKDCAESYAEYSLEPGQVYNHHFGAHEDWRIHEFEILP